MAILETSCKFIITDNTVQSDPNITLSILPVTPREFWTGETHISQAAVIHASSKKLNLSIRSISHPIMLIMTEHLVEIATTKPGTMSIPTKTAKKIPKDVPVLTPRLTIDKGSKPWCSLLRHHSHIDAM
jgi:hypothetical protein